MRYIIAQLESCCVDDTIGFVLVAVCTNASGVTASTPFALVFTSVAYRLLRVCIRRENSAACEIGCITVLVLL